MYGFIRRLGDSIQSSWKMKSILRCAVRTVMHLSFAAVFISACAPVYPISSPTPTDTPIPAKSIPIPPTPTTSKYVVQEPDLDFTVEQKAINSSNSAVEQKYRMQRWLDYWVKFEKRPFPLGHSKFTWDYVYDDKIKPSEVLVLIGVEQDSGEKNLFAPPMANGKFVDPSIMEFDYKADVYIPFEIESGNPNWWSSVEDGIPVRRDGNRAIMERLNLETGQWEEAWRLEKICINWRNVKLEGSIVTKEDVQSGRMLSADKDVARKLGMETFPESAFASEKLKIVKMENGVNDPLRFLFYDKNFSEYSYEIFLDYYDNPGKRPYRWLNFNNIVNKINGTEIGGILVSQQWLNPSGKISYLHYNLVYINDEKAMTFAFEQMHFGFPYYESENEKLLDEWVFTGEIPDELQYKMLNLLILNPAVEKIIN